MLMTAQPPDLIGHAAHRPTFATARASGAELGDFAIVHRLVRDYMRRQWGKIAFAVLCMLVTAITTGGVALLIDPTVKYIFLEKNREMLILIPLAAIGIVTLRALSAYAADSTINAVGERIVAAAQQDMFRSQVKLDLAAGEERHSGETVSKFLYDATLLRGSITRGVAGLGKEIVTLAALAGVMIYENWKLAVFSVLVLPLIASVTRAISK